MVVISINYTFSTTIQQFGDHTVDSVKMTFI